MSDATSPEHSSPLQAAVGRGTVPIALGLLCLVVSWPASEDLDPLLNGLGAILVVLGLVFVVATTRTLTAGQRSTAARRR